MKEKIGFVGLGLMGSAMADRLQKAGYPLFIYNRTKEKAQTLVSKGAVFCDSPSAAASQSEIIISMVSTPKVLEEISLGETGILAGLNRESIHIDCSTVSPEITERLAKIYESKNCHFIHSPVLGSIPQVLEGSLLLFVGGSEKAYLRSESVLRILGSKIWRFEKTEQASIIKLLCNSFISGMVVVLSQAFVMANKANIDPQILLDIISNSQLNAPMYQTKGNSIISRNFNPRFFVEHLYKDINLVLEAARSMKVSMPASETAEILYKKAIKNGLAKEDYSAIIKVLEEFAGIEVS